MVAPFEYQMPGRPWQTVGPTGAVLGAPPSAGTPFMAQVGVPFGEQQRAIWSEADRIQQQRQALAADYLARVQAGQRASLAEQQLGLGGLQQQQMAAAARGPLAQRAAMYGQGRAGGELIAQRAQQAAQEAMAARAMQQQAIGAGAAQGMAQAQQQLQGYGIAQQARVAREQAAAAEAAAEDEMIKQVTMGAIGAAGGAMAMSDRRVKREVRRPRSAHEQELYEALRGGRE
jgi:hypothetical protein